MRKGLILFFVLCCMLSFGLFGASASSAADNPSYLDLDLPRIPEITQEDRILVFAPHPDDEAIACAGIIQKAVKKGADINVVVLTNGDANQWSFIMYEKRLVFRRGEFLHMGKVRRQESINAMRILGLSEDRLIFLGYPDFGTLAIFRDYWNTKKPYKSLLSRVSHVPYEEDFSFGRPYIGESILFDLEEALRRYRPTKIFVSHPADVNSDHRAMVMFLQVALWDLKEELDPNLKTYYYLVHHKGWVLPRHYHPELNLLPPKDMRDLDASWQVSDLTQEELQKKHQAILAYKSQVSSSASYLLSFARKNELFGNFSNFVMKEGSQEGEIVWAAHPDLLWEEEKAEDQDKEINNVKTSQINYALKDGKIYIKLELNKQPLITDLAFFLFGYKEAVTFRDMPKIRIKVIGKTIRLSDKKVRLKSKDIYYSNEGKTIILGVPLKILGDPQSILTSVVASSRGVSSEAAAWRVIELQ